MLPVISDLRKKLSSNVHHAPIPSKPVMLWNLRLPTTAKACGVQARHVLILIAPLAAFVGVSLWLALGQRGLTFSSVFAGRDGLSAQP
jgi:hypothetical protein